MFDAFIETAIATAVSASAIAAGVVITSSAAAVAIVFGPEEGPLMKRKSKEDHRKRNRSNRCLARRAGGRPWP